jgi:glutamyl-tRNA reductase
MKLVAVTVSHHTTTLEDLERVTIAPDELPAALPCLLRAPDAVEAIALSTCNRTDVYAWTRNPEEAAEQIRFYLEDLKGLPTGWLSERSDAHLGNDAIHHLFRVAAGLDSMVQGEAEIQGQVRRAYTAAASLGTVGPHLHALFRWALETGKRARSEARLDRSKDSFPRAAVRALEAVFGELKERNIIVVGNGEMASASFRTLVEAGARTGVAARRPEAAEEMAGGLATFVLPIERLEEALVSADAAVFATGSPSPLIEREALGRVLASRDGSPLALVDLGLPRNVHPDVAELEEQQLVLYDLGRLDRESLTGTVDRNAQLSRMREIALEEAERCADWFRSKPADEVISAIQGQAERVAEEEAARIARKFKGLDERQQAEIAAAVRHGIRRIVHVPTVRAREACKRGDEGFLDAARWLFALDDPAHAVPDGDGHAPVTEASDA